MPDARKLLPRRQFKEGIDLSIIGLGGLTLAKLEQSRADRLVAESIDRGLNYCDVSPTYMDAQDIMGPAIEPYRERIFLACKTIERTAGGAMEELEKSLRTLRTDHLDLYQFHAVDKPEDIERILGPGGAAETFLKARRQGKVRFLGFSSHNAQTAVAMMKAMELDSVMFPVNFVCFNQPGSGPRVLEEAAGRGVARIALKAMAFRRVGQGQKQKYAKCWYEPVDDPELAAKALRFALSQDVVAALPPGDDQLFRMAIDIAAGFKPITPTEQQELFAAAAGVELLFKS